MLKLWRRPGGGRTSDIVVEVPPSDEHRRIVIACLDVIPADDHEPDGRPRVVLGTDAPRECEIYRGELFGRDGPDGWGGDGRTTDEDDRGWASGPWAKDWQMGDR